jgi:DNA adenine methylase
MDFAKPFIKWAGGKTQLISQIEKALPADINHKKYTYIEPFVGSGAVLFYLLQKYPNIQHAVINDINEDLVNTYKNVTNSPKQLIEILDEYQQQFHNLTSLQKQDYYYNIRNIYNSRTQTKLIQSAMFIFLNKTCFNGLYRVNRKSQFNVPIGSYKKPLICDRENILKCSQLLDRVEILNGDYQHTLDHANSDTIFYFDPPYKPVSKTSNFTSYDKNKFTDDEQLRLKDFCEKISGLNAKLILSNSDTLEGFFDRLYQNYNIYRVKAKRSINVNPEKRGQINELIITNFSL